MPILFFCVFTLFLSCEAMQSRPSLERMAIKNLTNSYSPKNNKSVPVYVLCTKTECNRQIKKEHLANHQADSHTTHIGNTYKCLFENCFFEITNNKHSVKWAALKEHMAQEHSN